MKAIVLFLLLAAFGACTNNATISGINNADTVELQDEFGRDAYPEIDSLQNDSSGRK